MSSPFETVFLKKGFLGDNGLWVKIARGFFSELKLEELASALPLEQNTVTFYGKTINVPRLISWHGPYDYTYGGQVNKAAPWPSRLVEIRQRVEEVVAAKFDSCLCNFYRDRNDSVGWHADDEPQVGPVVASVSFGATRRFLMTPKEGFYKYTEYPLSHGDLFVMGPGVQQAWKHSIPKEKGYVGPRLNLTFRQTLFTPEA